MSTQGNYISSGDRFKMKSGLWIKVIERITGKKIKIRFEESGYELIAEGVQIRRGTIRDWITHGYNVGDQFETKSCGKITILKYHNASKIEIQFNDTGWKTIVEGCQIKRGNIQDRLQPTAYGVGYLGVGHHRATSDNGKATWVYSRWAAMLERCYSAEFKMKSPNYALSQAAKEWLNFQVFAEWAVNQKGYDNPRWQLDKDIISKGNKLYTPDNCCFVPQELNTLIIKSEKARGPDPIGLSWHTNKKYVVHVSGTGESGYVGIYDDKEYAFSRYKEVKEKRIKQQAEKWKDKIDPRAYEALMNYQVEITD